jgi:tetratricopeptide (TPR) repeat protein
MLRMPHVADADMFNVRSTYCRALVAAGRACDATTVQQQALAASRATFGDAHAHTLRDVQALAESSHIAGDCAAAAALYAEAGAALKDMFGRFHPRTVHVLLLHARLCMQAGQYAAAEVLCEDAVSGYKQVIGGCWAQRQHWHSLVDLLNMLADIRTRQGRYAEAEALLRDAIATARHKAVPQTAGAGKSHSALSWSNSAFEHGSMYQLTRVLGMRHRFDDALQLLSQQEHHVALSTELQRQRAAGGRELMLLQGCRGALLQGAGRYSQAHDAYISAASLLFHPPQPLDPLEVDGASAAAADALPFLKQFQLQHLLPFASHCYTLAALLRAATLSPPLLRAALLPREFRSPPRHAVDSAEHHWRSCCRMCCLSCELMRMSSAQQHRLLCFGACAAAAAERLSSTDSRGGSCSRCALVAAANIARRYFSARGAQALLSTCTPPPEFACA